MRKLEVFMSIFGILETFFIEQNSELFKDGENI